MSPCPRCGVPFEIVCIGCLKESEPLHFQLGRKMARMLFDKYGKAAESKIPECYRMARSGLEYDTVRMAEKFLIGMS